METFGETVTVTDASVRVPCVGTSGLAYLNVLVYRGEHLVIVEMEDTRDGSRFFSHPMTDSEVEAYLGYSDQLNNEMHDSVYEYVGKTCYIKCPRHHDDNVVFNIWEG